MGEQREMTLKEWCNKLPKSHRVNKELSELEQELEKDKAVLDLKNDNTLVVAKNKPEFLYIIAYCEENKVLPPIMGNATKFPIALSINGGGWTDSMDRALNYVKFEDFIEAIKEEG